MVADTVRDTNPVFALKLKVYLCQALILGLILAVNIGALLLNWNGSRVWVFVLYASLRLMTPGGMFGSEKTAEGGSWRKFSEVYFIPSAVMRRYLQLDFGELPKEFVAAEARENSQFIFACFPHGCNSDYRIVMDAIIRQVAPNLVERDNMRYLAASVLFQIPIVRELTLWTGCIDASRNVADKALSQKKSLGIQVGGEAEQISTTYGKERVYLSKRKGFVKLAMRKGVPVVPVYVFGCNDSYYTYHATTTTGNHKFDWSFYKLRYKLMKNFGVCIMVHTGLWGSWMCPLPKKTTIVFGKPIRFQPKGKTTTATATNTSSAEGSSDGDTPRESEGNDESEGFEPTAEELDEAHALFVKELTALFNAHKERLGYGDRTLEVI